MRGRSIARGTREIVRFPGWFDAHLHTLGDGTQGDRAGDLAHRASICGEHLSAA